MEISELKAIVALNKFEKKNKHFQQNLPRSKSMYVQQIRDPNELEEELKDAVLLRLTDFFYLHINSFFHLIDFIINRSMNMRLLNHF